MPHIMTGIASARRGVHRGDRGRMIAVTNVSGFASSRRGFFWSDKIIAAWSPSVFAAWQSIPDWARLSATSSLHRGLGRAVNATALPMSRSTARRHEDF